LATTTAVIIVGKEAVLIYAIPPQSPQPPEIYDHSLTPLLITVPFPDGTAPVRRIWNTISSWYFSSSQSLYFDTVCEEFNLHKFQIIVEPDRSTASIHLINTSDLTKEDYICLSPEGYRICEDTLVSCWVYNDYCQSEFKCGVYAGLTSPDSAHGISHGGPSGKMLLPDMGRRYLLNGCPASGRFIRLDGSNLNSIAVLDFF
jgi:hypothetical protein